MSNKQNSDDSVLSEAPYGTRVHGGFVSIKDAEDFLAETCRGKICPWCESSKWDLIVRATSIDEDTEDGYVILSTEHFIDGDDEDGFITRPPSPAFTYPMFLVICDRCGFTRLHSLLTVLRWKAKNVTRTTDDQGPDDA